MSGSCLCCRTVQIGKGKAAFKRGKRKPADRAQRVRRVGVSAPRFQLWKDGPEGRGKPLCLLRVKVDAHANLLLGGDKHQLALFEGGGIGDGFRVIVSAAVNLIPVIPQAKYERRITGQAPQARHEQGPAAKVDVVHGQSDMFTPAQRPKDRTQGEIPATDPHDQPNHQKKDHKSAAVVTEQKQAYEKPAWHPDQHSKTHERQKPPPLARANGDHKVGSVLMRMA